MSLIAIIYAKKKKIPNQQNVVDEESPRSYSYSGNCITHVRYE